MKKFSMGHVNHENNKIYRISLSQVSLMTPVTWEEEGYVFEEQACNVHAKASCIIIIIMLEHSDLVTLAF